MRRAEVFRLREYRTDRLLAEWCVYVFPADVPPLREVPLVDRGDDYYISTDDFPTHADALAHALAATGLTDTTEKKESTMEHCDFCETTVDSVSTGGGVSICADCRGEAEVAR